MRFRNRSDAGRRLASRLQFLRGESRIKRALTVLKTRASSHDPRILEFEITSKGIELGEQFAEDQSLE